MNTTERPHLAEALHAAGHHVIQIKERSKAPRHRDWTTPRAPNIKNWGRDGVGVLGATTPAIDIDIDDEARAHGVRTALASLIGLTPLYRVGRPPRLLIPCQTATPLPKRVFTFTDSTGKVVGKVETLGDGQQWVGAGIHPDTGKPYAWGQGPVYGGPEMFALHPRADLPLLTASRIDTMYALLKAWAEPLGLTVTTSGSATSKPATAAATQESLRAPSSEALRTITRLIPNDEQFEDFESYNKIAYAIKAAAGPENEGEGEQAFLEWESRQHDGGSDPAAASELYRGLKPPFRVGWQWLCGLARDAGFDVAIEDFEIVAADATCVALPSDAERMAALHEYPDKVFVEHASACDGTDLETLWDSLTRASAAGDPQRALFRTATRAAKRSHLPTDDRGRFALLLDLELEANASVSAQWKACSVDERAFITRAVFVLLANEETLRSATVDDPGEPLSLRPTIREYLLDQLIPAGGEFAAIGPSMQGKTWWMNALGYAIGSNPEIDPLSKLEIPASFGGIPVQRGRVLYLSTEDAMGVVERTARRIERYGPARDFCIYDGTPPLSHLGRLVTYMRKAVTRSSYPGAPPIRLIIVDPLRGALDGDENDPGIVSAALGNFHLVARMFGATAGYVHHTPVSDSMRPRGSTVFLNRADCMLVAKKEGDDVTLFVLKNKGAAEGPPMSWHIEDDVLVPGTSDQSAAPHTGVQRTRDAELIAATLREMAPDGSDVVRKDLLDALAAKNPAHFEISKQNKKGKIGQRVDRGLDAAVVHGWASPVAGKKATYRPVFAPPESETDSEVPVGKQAGPRGETQ